VDGGVSFSTAPLLVPEQEYTGVQDLAFSDRANSTFLLGASIGTQPRIVRLYKSTDEGETFSAVSNVAADLGPASILEDGVLAINNAQNSSYRGNIYVAAFDFNAAVGKLLTSTDDGATFTSISYTTPAGTARQTGITIAPNGDVLLAVLGTQNDIYLLRSSDGGATLSAPLPLGARIHLSSDGSYPSAVPGNAVPRVAVSRVSNMIMVVYAGRSLREGDPGDVWFQSSMDLGATWTSPIQFGSVTLPRMQWAADIALSDDGRGIITWNDASWGERERTFRRSASVFAEDLGNLGNFSRFTPDFALTPHDSPIVWSSESDITGPGYAANKISDREGQLALQDGFLCTFAQTAFRAEGVSRESQADVYSVFVPSEGPGPMIEVVDLKVSGSRNAIAPQGCYEVIPTFRNVGPVTTSVTYGVELIDPPPGVSLALDNASIPLVVSALPVAGFPFTIATEEFDCAAGPIRVRLSTVADATGELFVQDLVVQSAASTGTAIHQSFGPFPIPDATEGVSHGTLEVPILVDDLPAESIGEVKVELHLRHAFLADLAVEIVDPRGTTWSLFERLPGTNVGANCFPDYTVFSDVPGVTAIERALSPHSGTLRPQGKLSELTWTSASMHNGTWTLRVRDMAGADVGTVDCVALTFSQPGCHSPAPLADDCLPAASFVSTSPVPGSIRPGGDSSFGPGECHAFYVTIQNRGPLPITGIRGAIVAAPGTNFSFPESGIRFPDLPAGGAVRSVGGVAVQFSSDVFVCPSIGEFTLQLESDQGNFDVVGSLPLAGSSSFFGALSTAPRALIQEGVPLEIPIVVSGFTGTLGFVELRLQIQHSAIGDLEVVLQNPSGDIFVPIIFPGDELRDDIGNPDLNLFATFGDSAPDELSDPRLNAPFTGYYRSVRPLSAFANTTESFVNGEWKLLIRDVGPLGRGIFERAQLDLLSAPCNSSPSYPCETDVQFHSYIPNVGGDGDQVLEPRECNEVQVSLISRGILPLTGAQLEFSSPTAITLGTTTINFPTLERGVVTKASDLLRMEIGDLSCNQPGFLGLNAAFQSDQTTRTLSVSFPVGTGPGELSYASTNELVLPIPDNDPNGVRSEASVGNYTGAIGDVQVAVHLTHDFVGDLRLTLISPSGGRYLLLDRFGGSRNSLGSDCSNELVFALAADRVTPLLGTLEESVTGETQPIDSFLPLLGLSGNRVNGTWELEVADVAAQDTGSLICWSISFRSAGCQDGIGAPCITEREGWMIY
jgi:subtilisin-like proprotein convertase family protein